MQDTLFPVSNLMWNEQVEKDLTLAQEYLNKNDYDRAGM